jgi:archaellum component FlaD/FlaE
VRFLRIDGKEVFEFKYRHATENLYKKFSLTTAKAELERNAKAETLRLEEETNAKLLELRKQTGEQQSALTDEETAAKLEKISTNFPSDKSIFFAASKKSENRVLL